MQRTQSKDLPPVLRTVQKRGFKIFQDGDYDLNLVACRRLKDNVQNEFDDVFHIVYRENDFWIDESCSCTTDPGRYWLEKEDYRADGVAILIHDQQARGAYKIGTHRGYKALQNIAPVQIWRDNNKDSRADYACSEVHKGVFATNIHRSSLRPGGSQYVERYSAGCIVIQDNNDFLTLLDRAEKQVLHRGYRTFTLTLLGLDYGCYDD